MALVFVTGFPGFIGSQLVQRRLESCPEAVSIVCLIQPVYRQQAEMRVKELLHEVGCPGDCLQLVEGDITEPDLGLGPRYAAIAADTSEIYHLAAVYDLGVQREFAMSINVDGTHHMLDFASSCPRLERFQYVSTCYVSGRHKGTFSESDLDCGQGFNNYYEETKLLAEVEVQRRMALGLPATIYRPSIVVGDSRTGATQKYDGIYYMLRFLLLQPRRLALVPKVGDPKQYEINVVPRDFVVDAVNYLASQPGSVGKVYQLCDPHPPSVYQIWEILADAVERQIVRIPISGGLMKWSLEKLWPINVYFKIEPATVNYVTTHSTRYTCENTLSDLEGSGIACPPIENYVGNLVDFMQAHPDISPAAMV
jgi:thioester reductase-like protein